MTSSIRNRRILILDGQRPAALAALRSLGRAGARVTLAWPQGEPRPDGCWSRYGHALLEHPALRGQEAEGLRKLVDWLVDGVVAKKWDAILPLGEATIMAVSQLRRRLPEGPIYAIPADPSLEYMLSRMQAARLADKLGISIPPTVFISDGDASQTWNQDFSSMSFPVAILIDPHTDAAGVYARGRNLVATDAEEARAMLRDLAGLRTGIIAQEILPGTGFEAAFLRRGKEWPLAFAHRSLHEVPWTGGPPSLALSYKNAKLLDLGRRFLEAAGFEGAATIEFRLNSRDNRFYFVRVVGRLWDSLSLALHAGADFPRVYLEGLFEAAARGAKGRGGRAAVESAAAGDPLLAAQYPAGLRCQDLFPGEVAHLRSVFRADRAKQGRPPKKWKALGETALAAINPRVRHANFWWSDPLPGIAAAARLGSELAGSGAKAGGPPQAKTG